MYIVAEFQTNEGTTSILTYTYDNQPQAEQKYHEVLAYAAISAVEIHAVSLMNEYGCVYKNEYYSHVPEVPEETEEVPEETEEVPESEG